MSIILNLSTQCLEMRIYGFNITLIIVACRLGHGEQYLLFLIFQEGGTISPKPPTLSTSPISPPEPKIVTILRPRKTVFYGLFYFAFHEYEDGIFYKNNILHSFHYDILFYITKFVYFILFITKTHILILICSSLSHTCVRNSSVNLPS